MLFGDVISSARNYEYMKSVVRDEKRIKDSAEVFTPMKLVIEIADEYEEEKNGNWAGHMRDTSCGDGQFLSEILFRKIIFHGKKFGVEYRLDKPDLDVNPALYLMVINEIWGVELLADNVRECHKRLGCGIVDNEGNCTDEEYRDGYEILMENIAQGDWLKIIKRIGMSPLLRDGIKIRGPSTFKNYWQNLDYDDILEKKNKQREKNIQLSHDKINKEKKKREMEKYRIKTLLI